MFGNQSRQNSPYGNATPELARYLADQAVAHARSNPHDVHARQQAAQYVQQAYGTAYARRSAVGPVWANEWGTAGALEHGPNAHATDEHF